MTEALNEAKELYGEERLLAALNEAGAGEISLPDLLSHVRLSLKDYVGNEPQSDDITMMGLSYDGSAKKEA